MAHRGIDDLSHDELARLVHEYQMAGQIIDRAGIPHVTARGGLDDMRDVAIDEWMGASPIYAKRMQRALGFEGTNVETALKAMQLDIGAPPEYLDFRMWVDDDEHGGFENRFCGALVDVEPMGDDYVITMCHRIQDPTFDATVWATNPKLRMRPIHRPPREPADRVPHCAWTVVIDPDIEDAPEPLQAKRLSKSLLARVPVSEVRERPGDGPGWLDYTHPLEPELRFRNFGQAALRVMADEMCVQSHLLVLSFADAVERRTSAEVAVELVTKQFTGTAGIVARRLHRALELGAGVDDVATLFELHPAFLPRSYVRWDVVVDGEVVRLALGDCPARQERGFTSWITTLAAGHDAALTAIAAEVDPHWQVTPDGHDRWVVAEGTEAVAELPEVALTGISSAASFEFTR